MKENRASRTLRSNRAQARADAVFPTLEEAEGEAPFHAYRTEDGMLQGAQAASSRTGTKIRFVVTAALVVLVIGIALFGDALVPFDPYEQNLALSKQPPSALHPFGTDEFGRDLLSRVIVGGKFTIFASLALVAIIVVVGCALGCLCGYRGGWIDSVIMRISDVFLAFPGMVFAIAVAGVLLGGLTSAVVALACISWPKYARLSRSLVLAVKSSSFIEAARLSGNRPYQIIVKDILPIIAGPIVVTAALDIGHMILEIAGLSFLGLGAQVPIPEWGAMMSNGRSMLQLYPWIILAPGLACFVTVMVFNLFADATRDMLDPKQRKRSSRRRGSKHKKAQGKEQQERLSPESVSEKG